jgi:dUTP pyrophosphatase
MLFDTGCTKNLCNNPSLYSTLTYYKKSAHPRYVALGDSQTHLLVKGYGTMDIIINHHRVQIHAHYVPDLPISILSCVDHIKYKNCTHTGSGNNLRVSFPTFHIDLPSSTNYEFPITAAKNDTLPVAFCSSTHALNPAKPLALSLHPTVQVKLLHPSAKAPKRATAGSTGYDLASIESTTLPPNSSTTISTGLAMAIPPSISCSIQPRSSLAIKHVHIGGGIIDNDYRGEIKVIMHNNSTTPITINESTNIAQLVFTPSSFPELNPVQSLDTTS